MFKANQMVPNLLDADGCEQRYTGFELVTKLTKPTKSTKWEFSVKFCRHTLTHYSIYDWPDLDEAGADRQVCLRAIDQYQIRSKWIHMKTPSPILNIALKPWWWIFQTSFKNLLLSLTNPLNGA